MNIYLKEFWYWWKKFCVLTSTTITIITLIISFLMVGSVIKTTVDANVTIHNNSNHDKIDWSKPVSLGTLEHTFNSSHFETMYIDISGYDVEQVGDVVIYRRKPNA